MKNYVVRIGDRTVRATVRETAGGYRVELDGEPVTVDVRSGSGPTRSMIIDDRSFETAVMESRDGMDVYVSGDVFHLQVVDELRARVEAAGGTADTGREEILSPMPGAVVSIPVSPGDRVGPGDTVAVVEAMKMQNEIAAVLGGRVHEVRVAAGDVVDPDQVLVVLLPETGDG